MATARKKTQRRSSRLAGRRKSSVVTTILIYIPGSGRAAPRHQVRKTKRSRR